MLMDELHQKVFMAFHTLADGKNHQKYFFPNVCNYVSCILPEVVLQWILIIQSQHSLRWWLGIVELETTT